MQNSTGKGSIIVSNSKPSGTTLLVATPQGDLFDVGPMVRDAQNMRRTMLQSAEFENGPVVASLRTMTDTLLDMQARVRLLGGDLAAEIFSAHLYPLSISSAYEETTRG